MKKIMLLVLCLAVLTSACGIAEETDGFSPRTYAVDAAQASVVRVVARDRTVEVSASPDQQIHISCHESEKEFYQIDVSEGVLTVELVQNKQWYDFIGGKSADAYRVIEIQIPDGAVDTLEIQTTNENVTLAPLSLLEGAYIDVNGGDIRFDSLSVASTLRLETKNGSVVGTIRDLVDAFTIKTEIKKGDSNLPEQMGDGEKTLEVCVNNGDIEISFI